MTVITSPSGLDLCDTCSISSYYQLLALGDPQMPESGIGVQPATLPNNTTISACNINLELGCSYNACRSLNDSVSRGLAGLPTAGSQISFSSFWGKSNRVCFMTYFQCRISTFSSTSCINVCSITGYSLGKTTITVCVPAGSVATNDLYRGTLGSCSPVLYPSLSITGTYPGDCVIIYNCGNVMGAGGNGAGIYSQDIYTGLYNGGNGGIAIFIKGAVSTAGCTKVTIYNYGHIWGGGGGGGGTCYSGGGGGAGLCGGFGGKGKYWCNGRFAEAPTTPIGTHGAVQIYPSCGDTSPGPGLCTSACGGGGGGGGGNSNYQTGGGCCVASFDQLGAGALGGWAGAAGGQSYDTAYNYCVGGGGGGCNCAAGSGGSGGGGNWGAYGGYANLSSSPGGLPGPAIQTNGSVNVIWGNQGNIRGPICCCNCFSY